MPNVKPCVKRVDPFVRDLTDMLINIGERLLCISWELVVQMHTYHDYIAYVEESKSVSYQDADLN